MRNVLLIGGPGSVIGRALQQRLASDGHRVATTRRTTDDGGSTSAAGVAVHRLDITDPDAVAGFVDSVDQELQGIDVLINNAGLFVGGLLPLTSTEQWTRVIDVNLMGVYHACKSVARKMMQRKSGDIINMTSLKAHSGEAGESAYAAAKAGVMALTRCLASELAAYQIRVNAVCPGFISSNISRFDDKAAQRAQERSLLDIGHNLEDVVSFISFLCSGRLQGVTGQVFHIDSRLH